MAETASMGEVGLGGYQMCFKGLPHGTCYHPGFRGTFDSSDKTYVEGKGGMFVGDMRPQLKSVMETEMKALASTAGGAGTAGYAMVPVYVDPRVVDVTRKFTPLVELIPRVTNLGTYADYNKITAKGGATTLAEDAAVAETTTTYDRASTAIKYVYAIGRVTGQAVAAIPGYTLGGFSPAGGAVGSFSDQSAANAMQMAVLVKTREIREKEEDLIINGDATTSASTHGVTGANGTEYSGIVSLMSTTNQLDKSSAAMGLDDINTAIRYAFDDGGRPTLAVCCSDVYTDLLKLLTAKIGYMQPQQQVFWGFSAIVLNTMVGPITVIPSMFMTNTTGAKQIFFLDMSVIEMRVLQDLTYEELAKTNDSRKFMLKIYECLLIKNTAFCSFIDNIA